MNKKTLDLLKKEIEEHNWRTEIWSPIGEKLWHCYTAGIDLNWTYFEDWIEEVAPHELEGYLNSHEIISLFVEENE